MSIQQNRKRTLQFVCQEEERSLAFVNSWLKSNDTKEFEILLEKIRKNRKSRKEHSSRLHAASYSLLKIRINYRTKEFWPEIYKNTLGKTFFRLLYQPIVFSGQKKMKRFPKEIINLILTYVFTGRVCY